MRPYDKWWTFLKVSEKERIASKVENRNVPYPECTEVWHSLSDEQQKYIHDHCVDRHGHVLKDWFDGKPYGD